MKNRSIKTMGGVSPVSIPCAKCGGKAMYQEWADTDLNGKLKRYGVIFCQDCDNKTKIHSDRTAKETKSECEYEWSRRNESIKKAIQ